MCIYDDAREILNEVGEAYRRLEHGLEELSKGRSEAIARMEKV